MAMDAVEGEWTSVLVFPAGSAMPTLKTLTFYRKGPFEMRAEYAHMQGLVSGTRQTLGTFKVALPQQAEVKKVTVKVKLTIHGTFTIESAQLEEKEEYEETTKEKREMLAEPQDPKSEPKKKYEWVDVKKLKSRTKKTDINIVAIGRPGLSANDLQKLMDEESSMQAEMRDITDTDERRNDLESYILNMRDKTSENGEYGASMSAFDRGKFHAELERTEDWLYDTPSATKVQYVEKLDALKKLGDGLPRKRRRLVDDSFKGA